MLIFDKLVRDKVVQRATKNGVFSESIIVSGDELIERKRKKILEEVEELLQTNNIEDFEEEIADLLEILKSLCIDKGGNWDRIEELRQKKLEKMGGFDEGIVLLKLERKF